MENSDGQPLGHGEDFDLDADHATPEVKEIVSENDPEVFFFYLSSGAFEHEFEIQILCS